MENEIIEQKDAPLVIDTMSIAQAQDQFKRLQQFVKTQMKDGRDFGIISGCKKPSLWKSGAERLLYFHGLGCKLESTSDTVVDWKNEFFNYCYWATVFNPRSSAVIVTAEGSCNSKETKYRYLWIPENKIPRDIDKEGLESRSGQYSTLYRIDNPEMCGLVNTIQKMACKRAMVAATLMACRASDIFTQDISDDEQQRVAGGVESPPASSGGSSSKATAPTGGGSNPISDKQRKMIFAKLKAIQKEPQDLHGYFEKIDPKVIDEKGDVHLSRIQRGDMTDLLKFMDERSADSGQEPS